MASIGKIAVVAASVAQETTVALSNINFDFSLVKLEAPFEYRALGTLLSPKRKREAEVGSIHLTARKLGALFSSDLSPIPNLTRAYGLRASEIVEDPKFNPRSSPSHGPFGDYVGADGTSIWAAATSGPDALAVHLLACLLARVWSGPEATAIWSELVVEREALLQDRLHQQNFPIGMVTASQLEIERHKLIQWDSSARSWIRNADSAKRAQQTQLMLVIDNMDLPIYRKSGVYSDVMHAWTQALTVVENLVSGVAQSVKLAKLYSVQAEWARNLYLHQGVVMSRAAAVACICMFESGELNLKPEGLDHILAVSCSNNIYASEILFSDPFEDSPAHAFRHVVGNVGKPVVVLLFSPRNTTVRKPDLENWDMVNHAPFDGRFEDNFASTSLHLSLTGYEQPVNTDDHGGRDSVVHFVEVVVSAHDRGVWHADLDLLRLATGDWTRILPADCQHTEEQIAHTSLLASCTSIDNWYEVLDRPRNTAIIRSHRNWIARLALAAVSSPKHQQLIIASDKPCCACLHERCESHEEPEEEYPEEEEPEEEESEDIGELLFLC